MSDNTTTARADLLDLLAQWFLTTGKGSREHADRILNKHAHELAERLRNVHASGEGDQWNWWDAADIPAACADLIDPEVT